MQSSRYQTLAFFRQTGGSSDLRAAWNRLYGQEGKTQVSKPLVPLYRPQQNVCHIFSSLNTSSKLKFCSCGLNFLTWDIFLTVKLCWSQFYSIETVTSVDLSLVNLYQWYVHFVVLISEFRCTIMNFRLRSEILLRRDLHLLHQSEMIPSSGREGQKSLWQQYTLEIAHFIRPLIPQWVFLHQSTWRREKLPVPHCMFRERTSFCIRMQLVTLMMPIEVLRRASTTTTTWRILKALLVISLVSVKVDLSPQPIVWHLRSDLGLQGSLKGPGPMKSWEKFLRQRTILPLGHLKIQALCLSSRHKFGMPSGFRPVVYLPAQTMLTLMAWRTLLLQPMTVFLTAIVKGHQDLWLRPFRHSHRPIPRPPVCRPPQTWNQSFLDPWA